jgi:hypothetical protein
MSRLSRQCGILNISQPYRPPRPVTGIALLFYFLYYLDFFTIRDDGQRPKSQQSEVSSFSFNIVCLMTSFPPPFWPNPSSRTMLTQTLKQMSIRKCFCRAECGRRVKLTTSSSSLSRLPRQCWILNIAQLHRPPGLLQG